MSLYAAQAGAVGSLIADSGIEVCMIEVVAVVW